MQVIKNRIKAIPICIFTYHKAGYWLFYKVFNQISALKNWKFHSLLGSQTGLPSDANVVLFAHSLIDPRNITTPFIGVHLVRDPRDIIVSGYLYHRRTKEKWCINSKFDLNPPIVFPQVPYSQQHRSEKWKREYLVSLKGKSYQENLLSLSQKDGLLFEMNHYASWTIEGMKSWNYTHENILEMKFENIMSSYNDSFALIFAHLGFSEEDISEGMNIARKHDLKRKTADEIQEMTHISSAKTVKK